MIADLLSYEYHLASYLPFIARVLHASLAFPDLMLPKIGFYNTREKLLCLSIRDIDK